MKREPAKLLNVPMESSSLSNKYYQKYIASQKGLVWIDPSDLQMLQRKFEIDQQYFKNALKRWMSIAWDSFRVIDDNSCSVIFTQCDENPESAERQRYDAAVQDSSVTLENIRSKLTYRYYSNVDEFVAEMETLFANWIQYNSERHRMYSQCINMRNRFRRFI